MEKKKCLLVYNIGKQDLLSSYKNIIEDIIVTIINLWEEIKHNIEDEKEFQNKLFTVISAWTTGIILIKTVEKIRFEKKETPIVNQISTNNSKNNHNFQVMLNYLKLR